MSPNQLKKLFLRKAGQRTAQPRVHRSFGNQERTLSCPLSHRHMWEGVAGVPQNSFRQHGEATSLVSLAGGGGGWGGAGGEGQKCQGPAVPLSRRRKTRQGTGGRCGLPTTHPAVFRAKGAPQCGPTQLFLLQETMGAQSLPRLIGKPGRRLIPPPTDSGCVLVPRGACVGGPHGAGQGHPPATGACVSAAHSLPPSALPGPVRLSALPQS